MAQALRHADAPAGDRPTLLAAGGPNAIAEALGIVGDEWTLWVLRMAMSAGFTFYNEWLHAGPISSSALTSRLGRLVEAGIMQRVPDRDRPTRSCYRLTARGRQMWPILLTMWTWEKTWVNEARRYLPTMRHATCGRAFTPQLICGECRRRVQARQVRGAFGPSGGWQRSVPTAQTRRRAHSGHRPTELITQTMALIGNRWSASLLGAAFLGATRFGQFEERMTAPPTIVADRLRTFTELGVLDCGPNPQRPDWIVYHLTDKGRAFFPVVACVLEWGQRWFQSPEGPALALTHTACGGPFRPRLECNRCRELLRGASVTVARRTGMPRG